MELLPYILVAVFAFFVGGAFGANRTLRLILQGRSLRRSYARIARFLPDAPPTRSPADMIAGRVPVMLGGRTYNVPTLPRQASREWVARLDENFATLATALDNTDATGDILTMLVAQTDALVDILLAYDRENVLPSRDEIDEIATDAEILYAVLEVWRAAHPLAGAVTSEADKPTSGSSLALSSSSPRPTDGDLTTSSEPSPTSSSSSTSMPPRTASTFTPKPGSPKPSKPSGSARSSRRTPRHTADGAHGGQPSHLPRAVEG